MFFVAIGILAYNFVAIKLRDFQAGDLGLGIATTAHEMLWSTFPINQTHGNYDLIVPTIKEFRKEERKVVLLAGNSQLHAINYYQQGDNLAVYHLNDLAKDQEAGFRFVQLSSPNINFGEMLIYYLSLRQRDLKPDWMVIGATYRCFQLTSFRQSFVSNLAEIDWTDQQVDSPIKKYYLEELVLAKGNSASSDPKTDQEKIENGITNFLTTHWEEYQYRGNVRSGIRIVPGVVYRNVVSRKNYYAGSKAVQDLNMQFLRELLRLCKSDGVRVFCMGLVCYGSGHCRFATRRHRE